LPPLGAFGHLVYRVDLPFQTPEGIILKPSGAVRGS
jgi:hypothetical protein